MKEWPDNNHLNSIQKSPEKKAKEAVVTTDLQSSHTHYLAWPKIGTGIL